MEATIKEVIEEMGFDVTVRDVMDFIEDDDLMRIHTALKKVSGTGKGLFWREAFGERQAQCAFVVSELQYGVEET